jgi:hypothetical protein
MLDGFIIVRFGERSRYRKSSGPKGTEPVCRDDYDCGKRLRKYLIQAAVQIEPCLYVDPDSRPLRDRGLLGGDYADFGYSEGEAAEQDIVQLHLRRQSRISRAKIERKQEPRQTWRRVVASLLPRRSADCISKCLPGEWSK